MSRPGSDDGIGPLSENRRMSPSEIRTTLVEVARERLKAERVDVSIAVTKLAMLRGQLYGRQLG
jgi:hypothetical protein